jgi:hypothetical protein
LFVTYFEKFKIYFTLHLAWNTEAYPRFEKWGTTFMASAEREPILGVWGLLPPEADEISAAQTLILP